MTTQYYVYTWDMDEQAFTPQKGVRAGPYSQFGLRKALRKLERMGYDVRPRCNANSVLVTSDPPATIAPNLDSASEMGWNRWPVKGAHHA